MLNAHLVTMLALKLDHSIFESNPASNADAIRGLKFVSGIQTLTAGGANGAALSSYDLLVKAVGKLRSANVPGPYAVAMHPDVLTELELLKDESGSQRQLPAPAGLPPIYTSSQLATNEVKGSANNARSIYVYAPSQLVLVRRTQAEIELDRSRLFNTDASEMRGRMRCDLLVPNPVSVVRIDGVIPPA